MDFAGDVKTQWSCATFYFYILAAISFIIHGKKQTGLWFPLVAEWREAGRNE